MTGFIDLANGCKTAVLALLLLLNLYQFLMVNPESGETVMIRYQEPDGTYVHVSLELNAGGAIYFETASEYSDGTWTCDEDSVICITLEDGRNYYASAWTMGGESYIWLLLELEECMVWLVDGRLMV